jgi:hypothetical protein
MGGNCTRSLPAPLLAEEMPDLSVMEDWVAGLGLMRGGLGLTRDGLGLMRGGVGRES